MITTQHGDTPLIRQRGESGYALLLVFAMAAAVALMLYIEMPRVAFEAQRNKEEMLIERGEQYKRAIQLYFRKFKQYPGSIEQLENTNNIRFLRRRYTDPLTGKDEWRLIHVGPGGVFTDSLTRKPKNPQDKQGGTRNTFITEAPTVGSTLADTQRTGAGPPRRPSEGGQPMQPGSPGFTDQQTAGQVASGQPAPGQPVPGQPVPGQVSAGPLPPASDEPETQPEEPADQNDTDQEGAQPAAGNPTGQPFITPAPGGATPGVPPNPVQAFPGAQANPFFNPANPAGQPVPGAQLPFGAQPGVVPQPVAPVTPSPFGQTGASFNPNQPAQNQAADMIRNLLTQPRAFPGGVPPNMAQGGGFPGGASPGGFPGGAMGPGGFPGAGGAGPGGFPMGGGVGPGGMQIGGGIAGVASKVEKRGIKVYNDHDKYNEWEFIYDFAQDRTGAGRLAGMMGSGDPRLQQQGGQAGFGTPGFGGAAGFGGQGGFGGQAGFGAPGFGSPGFGSQPGMGGTSGSGGSSTSTGGIGSGFGGGIGSGFGGQAPSTGQPTQPTTPPQQQPAPQPGAPPPPPPPNQSGNPPN